MKQSNSTRKGLFLFSHRFVVSILIILAILSFSIVILAVRQSHTADRTQKSLQTQQQALDGVNKSLKAIQVGNPNLLSDCLNRAGTDYINAVKSQGQISTDPSGNKATYYQNPGDWEKINNKYEADKTQCHKLYGESPS